MSTAVRRWASIALLALSAACASSGPHDQRRVDRNVLTREQMLEHRFTTAFDAVSSLRSNWLITKGTDSFQNPSVVWVYVDSNKLGGVESLRQIAPSTVVTIRYFDGIAATARWGIDHGSGVILVSTHR
jgi:hypothetical protein